MTGRIRWEAEPSGYAAFASGFPGPADWGWRMFIIWKPGSHADPAFAADPRHFLTSDLPGNGTRWHFGSPDDLQAEAERWLEEFVSSLGAVFPEPLTDSQRFQLSEARDLLALWDQNRGGLDVFGTERTLADQVRALLAILDATTTPSPGKEKEQ